MDQLFLIAVVDVATGRACAVSTPTDVPETLAHFPALNDTVDVELLNWVKFSRLSRPIEAVNAAHKWIEAASPKFAIHGRWPAERRLPYLEVRYGENESGDFDQRIVIIKKLALGLILKGDHMSGVCLAGAIARSLCARNRIPECLSFLSESMRSESSYFLDMFHYAATQLLHGRPLNKPLTYLMTGQGNYFKNKFCPMPFTDFEITRHKAVAICCPSYLPHSIGDAAKESGEKILNSNRAIEIRKSILDGSFAWCDWVKCPQIKGEILPDRDAVSDPEMRDHMERNTGVIDAPRHLRTSMDPTCNLHCPTCRTGPIAAKPAEVDEIIRITDESLRPFLPQAQTLMMNGYGDVFSSRSCRHILESMSTTEHPNLKLNFITNGVLFSKKEWEKFPNIHGMVNSIRVSIDAVSKPTYDKIRLGGDFDRLKENLEFISSLRRGGVISEFVISMVVQHENFREVEDFCEWGRSLGCDIVLFEIVQDWLDSPEYQEMAVHLPQHRANPAFQAIIPRMTARAAEWNARSGTHIHWDFGTI